MPKQTFLKLSPDKRSMIEAVAIDEFAENPYQCASISAIVAKAGIAKGSFYQYFDGKQDLYLHLLALANQQKGELVRQVKPSEKAMNTLDYVRWMLQLAFLFEVRFPKLAKIAYRSFVEDLPFLDEVEGELHRGGAFYFNDFLSQGVFHEDVATWVDIDMASFLLTLIYHHFGPYLLKRLQLSEADFAEGRLDIFGDQLVQDLYDNLLDLLSAGIGRDPEIRRQFFNK